MYSAFQHRVSKFRVNNPFQFSALTPIILPPNGLVDWHRIGLPTNIPWPASSLDIHGLGGVGAGAWLGCFRAAPVLDWVSAGDDDGTSFILNA